MKTRGSPRLAAGGGFIGRRAELEALSSLFEAAGPELALLSGLPGIGKSALLEEFARRGRDAGERVHVLDCRTVEPTQRCFTEAVEGAGLEPGADRPRVLCLDHYDHFLLLDAWLRSWFRRELGTGVRLVLAGRRAPGMGWSVMGARALAVRLDVLDEESVTRLLGAAGVRGESADRIRRFTKGHPLALSLALFAGHSFSEEDLEALALPDVVRRLTGFFLEDVQEPETREALEAASTVRRVTRPLLREMLARQSGGALYETLASLPLVDVRRDGLSLHPTVHEAVARWLRAADPARFTAYRRRAWRALERDRASLAAVDLWRYTADVIYLIEDPIVREAFFPSDSRTLAVDAARSDDHAAVLDITALHGGAEERDTIAHWLATLPEAFHVVRDAGGDVQGFYLLFDPAAASARALARDPLACAWQADLPDESRAQRRRVLFLRRWLSRAHGDAPSPVQAACWLDVKRAYLENRPHLRRVYLAVSDLAPYATAAGKLGFVPVCADLDSTLASAMLDFGPGSVDAWLGRLVRGELGIAESVAVDPQRHALSLGEDTIPLTPRELAVARILVDANGAVVGREELLEQAWGGGQAVGSNVVDVLVRALRRKLGAQAGAIETVRGVGYRWRA